MDLLLAEMLVLARQDIDNAVRGSLPCGVERHEADLIPDIVANAKAFLRSEFAQWAFAQFGVRQRHALRSLPC